MNDDIINIPETEKLYEDEWLLFEVLEVDEQNRPMKGRLLAHSKSREDIHNVAMERKPSMGYTTFTGEPVPKDMAVVL